jgi:hypothetical protein
MGFIDGKYRCVVDDIPLRQYRLHLVVENKNVRAARDCQDRMRDAQIGVLHDHQAQVVVREAKPAQREKLGDGVVLTIAAVAQKLSGNGPVILNAEVLQIEHVCGLLA